MKLKECPFCGGDAEIETEKYGGTSNTANTISCVEGCVVMGDLYGSEKEAIKRWNKRIK